MQLLRKMCLVVSGAALLVLVAGLAARNGSLWQPAAVASCVALAVGLGVLPEARTYQFTVWIVAAVVAALINPSYFLYIGPIDLPFLYIDRVDLRDKLIILAIM